MPINSIIAQGTQPVDVTNTLMRIATMQQADRESARRDNYQNALLTRMNRTDMRTRMDRDEAKTKAAELEEMKVLYPLVKAGDSAAIEAAIKRIEERNPEAGASVRANPKVLAEIMGNALGIKPDAPETMRVGDEIVRVGPEGVTPLYRGRSNYAPRTPTEFELYQRDPEAYKRFKQAQGSDRADRPQVITDPWGGDPSVIEQGPDGNYVRRPVPMADGSGPTNMRAQAFTEARAAIATGKISKEQAAERLRKAGIDPSGL